MVQAHRWGGPLMPKPEWFGELWDDGRLVEQPDGSILLTSHGGMPLACPPVQLGEWLIWAPDDPYGWGFKVVDDETFNKVYKHIETKVAVHG